MDLYPPCSFLFFSFFGMLVWCFFCWGKEGLGEGYAIKHGRLLIAHVKPHSVCSGKRHLAIVKQNFMLLKYHLMWSSHPFCFKAYEGLLSSRGGHAWEYFYELAMYSMSEAICLQSSSISLPSWDFATLLFTRTWWNSICASWLLWQFCWKWVANPFPVISESFVSFFCWSIDCCLSCFLRRTCWWHRH